MEIIGIVCEYNPFHNGHIYHINEIKKLYPDSLIILVINGYFLQRGEISLLSKYDKATIALENSVDIVVELPCTFGTQSADIFAYNAIKILNYFHINKIIFGSETNDVNLLKILAKEQDEENYNLKIKNLLKEGLNYPTALSKAFNNGTILNSNDLLGLSYIKAINKINNTIIPETIKRTNNYLDTNSNDNIISASNIREKLKNNIDISPYVPKIIPNKLNCINEDLLFNILKTIIIRSDNLNEYLDVDEGIESRLKNEIIHSNNLNEFCEKIKTKRYTYNKINRMFIHILLGIKKDINNFNLDYVKILGFNNDGKKYLNKIKKDLPTNIDKTSLIYKTELNASLIYDLLTNNNANYKFEKSNKPIKK